MLYTGPSADLPDREPSTTERCGISSRSPRRAALLFDRVYVPYFSNFDLSGASRDFILKRTFGIRDIDSRVLQRVLQNTATQLSEAHSPKQLLATVEHSRLRLGSLPIRVAAEMYRAEGYCMVPTYGEDAAFLEEFGGRDSLAWQVTLAEIPVVDERVLSWQAVERFREDASLQGRYKALHELLERPLLRRDISNPEVEADITREILNHLASYEDALHKHDLAVVRGAISTVVAVAGIATTAIPVLGGFLPYSVSVASALLAVDSLLLARSSERAARANPLALVYEMGSRFRDRARTAAE